MLHFLLLGQPEKYKKHLENTEKEHFWKNYNSTEQG